jgi:hypothetical protein
MITFLSLILSSILKACKSNVPNDGYKEKKTIKQDVYSLKEIKKLASYSLEEINDWLFNNKYNPDLGSFKLQTRDKE